MTDADLKTMAARAGMAERLHRVLRWMRDNPTLEGLDRVSALREADEAISAYEKNTTPEAVERKAKEIT